MAGFLFAIQIPDNKIYNTLPLIKLYSEEELILLLNARDQRGFAYLYENYASTLGNIIIRIIKEPELSEDILQEVFIKVWNNFDHYDKTKGRLFTWLVSLTKNMTIDTIRSKCYKNQSKISTTDKFIINYYDKSIGSERFDAIGLRRQLAHLKPVHKRIIDLAYFNGFTQLEISNEIGIPLGTVKTRMRSAILELRNVILKKNVFDYNGYCISKNM